MSLLRSICVVLLTLIFTFQASFVTVSAVTDDESTAINSIDALQIPAEMMEEDSQDTVGKTELKMDIQSLLQANREYTQELSGSTDSPSPLRNTITET